MRPNQINSSPESLHSTLSPYAQNFSPMSSKIPYIAPNISKNQLEEQNGQKYHEVLPQPSTDVCHQLDSTEGYHTHLYPYSSDTSSSRVGEKARSELAIKQPEVERSNGICWRSKLNPAAACWTSPITTSARDQWSLQASQEATSAPQQFVTISSPRSPLSHLEIPRYPGHMSSSPQLMEKTPPLGVGSSPFESWSGVEFCPSTQSRLSASSELTENQDITAEFKRKVLEALGSSPPLVEKPVIEHDRVYWQPSEAGGNSMVGSTPVVSGSCLKPCGKFELSDFPPLEHLDGTRLSQTLGWGQQKIDDSSSYHSSHKWITSEPWQRSGARVANEKEQATRTHERTLATMFSEAGAVIDSCSTSSTKWAPLDVPLTFKPEVATWSGNDILLGGSEGQIGILRYSTSHQSLFTLTPIFCFESYWRRPTRWNRNAEGCFEFHESRDSCWVHLDRIADNGIAGIAQDGIYYAELVGTPYAKKFVPVPQQISSQDTLLRILPGSRKRKTDRVSAVASSALLNHQLALGTEQGLVHLADIELGKIIQTVDVNTIKTSIASPRITNDDSASSLLSYPDSLLSGTNFRGDRNNKINFDSDSISTVHNPFTFGTVNGNVVLFDARASLKQVQKLKIFRGPILEVSRCDWDLLILGTDNLCTINQIWKEDDDVVMRYEARKKAAEIYQINAHLDMANATRPPGQSLKSKKSKRYGSLLSWEIKNLAVTQKWPTFVAIVDFRTLRFLEIASNDLLGMSNKADGPGTLESYRPDRSCHSGTGLNNSGATSSSVTSYDNSLYTTRCTQVDALYRNVVSILDPLVDPNSENKATVKLPDCRASDSDSSKKSPLLSLPPLQLLSIKSRPQLYPHMIGLNNDGRILFLEVTSNQGLSLVHCLTPPLPGPALPLYFGTPYDNISHVLAVVLTSNGSVSVATARPPGNIRQPPSASASEEFQWKIPGASQWDYMSDHYSSHSHDSSAARDIKQGPDIGEKSGFLTNEAQRDTGDIHSRNNEQQSFLPNQSQFDASANDYDLRQTPLLHNVNYDRPTEYETTTEQQYYDSSSVPAYCSNYLHHQQQQVVESAFCYDINECSSQNASGIQLAPMPSSGHPYLAASEPHESWTDYSGPLRDEAQWCDIETLSEWTRSRPPKQYRWLPTKAVIESFRAVLHREHRVNRSSQGFHVNIHPLNEAIFVRDVESLGLEAATTVAAIEGIDDYDEECSHEEILDVTGESAEQFRTENCGGTELSDESVGDSSQGSSRSPRTVNTCLTNQAECNEGDENKELILGLHTEGEFPKELEIRIGRKECIPQYRTSWNTVLSHFEIKAVMHEPEEALGLFNRVGPSGLESSRQFAFVNAVVQVLRFIPQLEHQMVRHHCEKETCLACELGLLWHMLDLASEEGSGRPCRAKNFLYAFKKIPEVRLCHLLPDELSYSSQLKDDPNRTDDLGKSVQVFLVFLLQHLRRELSGDSDDTPHHVPQPKSISKDSPRTSPAEFDTKTRRTYERSGQQQVSRPSSPVSSKPSSLTTSPPYLTATQPSIPLIDYASTSSAALSKLPEHQYPEFRNIVDYLFGCTSTTTSTCVTHQHRTVASPVTRFIVDLLAPSEDPLTNQFRSKSNGRKVSTGSSEGLIAPRALQDPSKPPQMKEPQMTFASALKSSLQRRFTLNGFCKLCERNVKMIHSEKVAHVPPLLALNCRPYFGDPSGTSNIPMLPSEFWLRSSSDEKGRAVEDIQISMNNQFGQNESEKNSEGGGSQEESSPSLIQDDTNKTDNWRRFELMATIFVVREKSPWCKEFCKGMKTEGRCEGSSSLLVPHRDLPFSGSGYNQTGAYNKEHSKHHHDFNSPWNHGRSNLFSLSRNYLDHPLNHQKEQYSPDHLVAHIKVPKLLVNPNIHHHVDRPTSIDKTILSTAGAAEKGSSIQKPQYRFSTDNWDAKRLSGDDSSCPDTGSVLSDVNDYQTSDDFRTFVPVVSNGSTKELDCNGTAWITMNDSLVTFADEEEVHDTTKSWKSLAFLFYLCMEELVAMEFSSPDCHIAASRDSSQLQNIAVAAPLHQQVKCPIPRSVMLKYVNLSRHPAAPRTAETLFTPLTEKEAIEIEEKGRILSLDAEFVRMKRTQDLREDSLSFARLSVIRGDGELEGIPCLDCHILTHQTPEDYLTQLVFREPCRSSDRYSGVRPGDLDETHSHYWLTTRKCVYQKLRYLLDHQCTFIGHGLSKDFSIINLFVPKSQMIDTVQLYRLPGRRLLSLKFLAHHLLQLSVQDSDLGHDSVEDAYVALQLYKRYKELEKSGDLSAVLRYLYKIGSKTHWSVPTVGTTMKDSETYEGRGRSVMAELMAAHAGHQLTQKEKAKVKDFRATKGHLAACRAGQTHNRLQNPLVPDVQHHSDKCGLPLVKEYPEVLQPQDLQFSEPSILAQNEECTFQLAPQGLLNDASIVSFTSKNTTHQLQDVWPQQEAYPINEPLVPQQLLLFRYYNQIGELLTQHRPTTLPHNKWGQEENLPSLFGVSPLVEDPQESSDTNQ